jgi:hypothetical protein
LTLASVPGRRLPSAVVGHRALNRKHAAIFVCDDQLKWKIRHATLILLDRALNLTRSAQDTEGCARSIPPMSRRSRADRRDGGLATGHCGGGRKRGALLGGLRRARYACNNQDLLQLTAGAFFMAQQDGGAVQA